MWCPTPWLATAVAAALAGGAAFAAGKDTAMPDLRDDPRFFAFAMPLERPLAGAPDVSSWLPRPAGRDGFVRVEDGRLVDGAGRQLRLLGTNTCFSANFPTREEAELTARRLACLGINCVRFHHMDMQAAPGGIWESNEDSRHLSEEMLDRLDYFIARLKEHGIYADLNLRVMRQYKAGDGFGEERPGTDKGVDNYMPGMIELQKHYARELLTHVNPYTGNAYADEPAVALVEITNENSLYNVWNEGGVLATLSRERLSLLPDRYVAPLRARWNGWLRERYPTARQLRAAWNGGEQQVSDERFAGGDLPIVHPKLAAYGPEALADGGRFIVTVVRGYMEGMYRFLTDDLGVKVPIIGTQIGFGTPLEQAGMDAIDVHTYWHHPIFLGQQWQKPWVVAQEAMVNHPVGAMEVFGHGLAGKPLLCTEYCHPWPNLYRAEQVPVSAAYAAYQNLDGLFYFAWAHSREDLRATRIGSFFDHQPEVGKLVTMPFASALLVRGEAEPAGARALCTLPTDGFAAALGSADLFSTFHSDMIERARESYVGLLGEEAIKAMMGGELPEMPEPPFDLKARAMLASGLRLALGEEYEAPEVELPTGGPYTADTGQLRWDVSEPGRGYVTIDTPRAKAAVGFIGGRTIELGPVTIEVADTYLDGFAVVTLLALEGQIGAPGFRGLLSCVGNVQNRGQQWQDERRLSVEAIGEGPPLCEGIAAKITLEGTEGLRAWALSSTGERAEEMAVDRADEEARLITGPRYRTLWYELSTP